ncbi:MAG: DEAD/DEAH box helicase, partial [Clostridia bacterium]|nr:DEAD/DEAH box helicase [Clostridia bacterium]
MTNFIDKLNNVTAYTNLLADTRGKFFTTAFGVQPNEKPFVASSSDSFVLYVASDYVDAQRILRTLNTLKGNFVYLPYRDDVLLYKQNSSVNLTIQRNVALHQMLNGANGAVVCCESLTQPLLPRDYLAQNTFTLSVGDQINLDVLSSRLVQCGYKRVDSIDGTGQFARRGDIVEMYTHEHRVRLDFFDDEVEQIVQLSHDGSGKTPQNCVTVLPLTETTGANQSVLTQVGSYVSRQRLTPDAKAKLDQIFAQLSLNAGGRSVDNAWLAPFLPQGKLADYLPQDALIVWDEPKQIADKVNFLYQEHDARLANLLGAGEVLPAHSQALLDRFAVYDNFKGFHQLALQTMVYAGTFFRPQVTHSFTTSATPTFNQINADVVKTVNNWQLNGYEIVVFAGSEAAVQQVGEQLANNNLYFTTGEKFVQGSAQGYLLPQAIERGFISHTNKLVVLGTRDVGRSMTDAKLGKSKKQVFLSVEKGDYVVHDFHGIGLCEGIQKIDNGAGEKDYVVVLYKKGARLYVPVDNANMLSRYSGGEKPTLSRIGGEDFAKVKSKVKSGIKQMSINLLKLYAEREKPRGFTYQVDAWLAEQFAQAFPYKETADQLKCIEEINADLQSKRIMDRILVGDVGFGKTEVAMRAVFNVVASGYQAAVLVPTTILAEQHYKTFVNRMADFDIRVACLNRFRNDKKQKQIIEQIRQGDVDVVIGTHRLLSKDVVFDRLGLLVLDEEQRFGVEHKEHIKDIKRKVDVLTLSATPIPRTLHMALSGIRDISTITTAPVARQPVATFVVEQSQAILKDVISREVGRGGQVFLLYNHVETIDAFAASVQGLLPDCRLIVAHGKMKESVLEDNVYRFQQGQADVLICTTIIENGIDIPNANTIIVCDADCLGLSQLYQLRGRVGRGNRLAYAYFTY